MILDNMTMFWLWYPVNGGYSLVCKVFLLGLMLTYMRDILVNNLKIIIIIIIVTILGRGVWKLLFLFLEFFMFMYMYVLGLIELKL